jgi:hypothetical protein
VRRGAWAAAAIALVSSAVALVGVWRNRAGAPEAEIELNERETPVGWVGDENTGLSLEVRWAEPRRDWNEAGWFGQERLEAAGFDCSLPLDAPDAEIRYRKILSREAYAVLEYDGPAWREWLAHEEEDLAEAEARFRQGKLEKQEIEWRRRYLAGVRRGHTRLFVIDVGRDPDELRRIHPDRERALVVHALLSLDYVRPWDDKRRVQLAPFLRGRVDRLLIDSIHVPRALRGPLDSARAAAGKRSIDERGPLYAARFTYGARREPWLRGARLLEPPPR